MKDIMKVNSKDNKMSDIENCPFPSFPNFTKEMYDGNAPCRKGYRMIDGGESDSWTTKYGDGETYKGEIINAKFNINQKITIYITGNHLWIMDLRYSGKNDFWEYTNIKGRGAICSNESLQHSLEPDKIEKILNTKIENCKFWDIVQARAKELYSQGIITN